MIDLVKRLKEMAGDAKGLSRLLVGLGLLGLLLLSLSGLGSGGTAQAEQTAQALAAEGAVPYDAALEERLAALVEQVEGVGEARVMVTFEAGADTVYATDLRTGNNSTEEEHVLLQNGSEALVETIYTPLVQGVAVVCQGAEDPGVEGKLTEMLTVLLGVSSNRISITKMN